MEVYSLKGSNGVLKVYDDRAVISRNTINGIIYQGIKGEKVFFYSNLSSVEYKKPSILTTGYIKFITAGTIERKQDVGLFGISSSKSLKDPNTLTIPYTQKVLEKSNEIYEYILKHINDSRNVTIIQNNNPQNENSNLDEILKFKKLLDEGVITQEEFNKKKKELLDL